MAFGVWAFGRLGVWAFGNFLVALSVCKKFRRRTGGALQSLGIAKKGVRIQDPVLYDALRL